MKWVEGLRWRRLEASNRPEDLAFRPVREPWPTSGVVAEVVGVSLEAFAPRRRNSALRALGVSGTVDLIGVANAQSAEEVNEEATYRNGEYYQAPVGEDNSSTAVYPEYTVIAELDSVYSTNEGSIFIPKTPQSLSYDADGNLTNDGRWSFTWDAENRLTSLISLDGIPSGASNAVYYSYDDIGRRTSEVVSNWTGSAWSLEEDVRYLYDDWNLIAELDSSGTPVRSYSWGQDLSGSMQGAGGVGGLVGITVHSGDNSGTYFYSYDGNGNVVALVDAADGVVAAEYEYDPFGGLIRATGELALENRFRFSTKYSDDESDFIYYGHRFYSPSLGKWLSRDPIDEFGGWNLYGFASADPVNRIDYLGSLDETWSLFASNLRDNALSDSVAIASHFTSRAKGVVSGLFHHQITRSQDLYKGELSIGQFFPGFDPFIAFEDARDSLNSVIATARTAGDISGDPCKLETAKKQLADYLSSREGIVDLTLLAEALLLSRGKTGLASEEALTSTVPRTAAERGTVRVFSSEGTLGGGGISLDEALAAAQRNGIDTRLFKLEYGGADSRYFGHTSFTPTDLTLESFKIVRTPDGRAIIKLYDNALTSQRAAVETIAHEINHIRGVFKRGIYTSEEAAEAAARAAGQHFK